MRGSLPFSACPAFAVAALTIAALTIAALTAAALTTAALTGVVLTVAVATIISVRSAAADVLTLGEAAIASASGACSATTASAAARDQMHVRRWAKHASLPHLRPYSK